MIELLCTLIGTGIGAWASWHITGNHYRKLIRELIDRNCTLIAEMRADQGQGQGQQEPTSSAA
jgi:hypothetical protein